MTFEIIPRKESLPEDDPDFDPTIFGPDWREKYMLSADDWKFDSIPEIIDGKNIADYIELTFYFALMNWKEKKKKGYKNSSLK